MTTKKKSSIIQTKEGDGGGVTVLAKKGKCQLDEKFAEGICGFL